MNIQTNKIPMSQKDREELASFKAATKKFIEKHTASPQAARKFLVKLGTHDENGNLTENYQAKYK